MHTNNNNNLTRWTSEQNADWYQNITTIATHLVGGFGVSPLAILPDISSETSVSQLPCIKYKVYKNSKAIRITRYKINKKWTL